MSMPPRDVESSPDVPLPSGSDAKATLDQLALDRAHLADRVVAPGWYAPAGAGLLGVFVFAQYVDGFWWFGLQAVFYIGFAALGRAYRKSLGVVFYGWSRGLVLLGVGFGLIEVGCCWVARRAGEGSLPQWSVGAAVAVAVVTSLLFVARGDAMSRSTLRKAP